MDSSGDFYPQAGSEEHTTRKNGMQDLELTWVVLIEYEYEYRQRLSTNTKKQCCLLTIESIELAISNTAKANDSFRRWWHEIIV